MVRLQKALAFGGAVWLAIALLSALLPLPGIISEGDSRLLMVPISLIIILLASFEYLKEIHAQYENEGLEIAMVWAGEAVFLEALVFVLVLGRGVDYFFDISVWLGILFKFVFPLATGMYMQHTLTE